MVNREHENDNRLILDRADRPPVPDTILPELSELRAFERGADAARIVPAFSPVVEELQYPLRYLLIEFP